MTVTSEVNRIAYSGNNTAGPYAVPFYFISPGDLLVYRRVGDNESLLTLNRDYSVSGAGAPAGGSVTLSSALPAGIGLHIIRNPSMQQDAAYVDHARFPAASHERALDKGRMIEQRTRDLVTRTLRLKDTDTPGLASYSANFNRITDLGDPLGTGDAVSQIWVTTKLNGLGEGKLLSLADLVQTAIINKVGRPVDIQDFALDAGGLYSALSAANQKGRVNLHGARLSVSASVILPMQTGIDGGAMPSVRSDVIGTGFVDQTTARGAIILNASASLDVTKPGTWLQRMTLLPAGVDLTKTNGTDAEKVAMRNSFAGTAIKGSQTSDVRLKELLIAGFDVGVDIRHGGGGRVCVEDLGIDCTTGMRVTGGADIDRISNVHVWPFLTVTGSDPTTLTREGPGFYFGKDDDEFGSYDDFFEVNNCFALGHRIGFEIYNGSGVHLTGCKADGPYSAPGDSAFYVHGGGHEVKIIDPFIYAGGFLCGIKVDAGPGIGGHPSWVHIDGGTIGGVGNAVQLLRGSLIISGKPALGSPGFLQGGGLAPTPHPGAAIYIGPDASNLVADLGTVESPAVFIVDPGWNGDIIDITLPAFGGGYGNSIYNEAELSVAQRNKIIIRGANQLAGIGGTDRLIRALKMSGPNGGSLQIENLAAPHGNLSNHELLAGPDGSFSIRGLTPTGPTVPMLTLSRDVNGIPKSPYFPIPSFADAASAASAGVPVNGLWCTPDGIVRKR